MLWSQNCCEFQFLLPGSVTSLVNPQPGLAPMGWWRSWLARRSHSCLSYPEVESSSLSHPNFLGPPAQLLCVCILLGQRAVGTFNEQSTALAHEKDCSCTRGMHFSFWILDRDGQIICFHTSTLQSFWTRSRVRAIGMRERQQHRDFTRI